MLLELDGYDVRTALDGESALQIAASFLPELIVLDIAMPKLNGYEVCRRLRSSPDGQKALIVALTGYAGRADRQRARIAGFDGYFVKPIDPSLLERFIADHGREPTE